MLYIEEKDIDKLLDFYKIVNMTKEGFKKYSEGLTLTPPYINFLIDKVDGHVHFKSGYILGDKYFTLKYSGGFWENEKKNIPVDNGLFLVFDSETGIPVCLINDGGNLTNYRTGVAGAIATKLLARENSKIITVIGTGVQAREQIKALMKLMDIEYLKVWGRNKNNAEKYANDMKQLYPNLKIENYNNIQDSIDSADIIITTTYSNKPLLKSEWIKPGMHITAVGACGPNMQELDETIFKKAKVFADSKEMCSLNGEIGYAIRNKIIEQKDVREIGELIGGYNRNDEDITVVDLVGLGFQDAIVGSYIYEKAVGTNTGTNI